MSNVQFEDPYAGMQRFDPESQTHKGLIGMLIKNGFAKDVATANIVLVSVIVVCVIVSIFFIMKGGGMDVARPPAEQIQLMQHLPKI